MSCSDELAVLAEEDLIDIVLRDDIPCSKIPVEENGLLEDSDLQDPELLDKELDDLINSVLSLIEDKPGTLQSCCPPDSGIPEYHHLSHIPGSNSVSIPWSSGVVQVDHNYSLHEDWPGLQSVRSDMAQQDVSIGFGTWVGLEGTSRALEQSFSFPMVVDVDNGPQFLSEAIMQSFPQVVLTEEERQLLEKESVALLSCLPLIKAEKLLLKKVRRRIRNKQSARNSRRRRRMFVDGLEYRVINNTGLAVCLGPSRLSGSQYSSEPQAGKEGAAAQKAEHAIAQAVMETAGLGQEVHHQSYEKESLHYVLSQQIPEFSGQLKPHLQEDSVVEGFSPEPKDLFMSGSLNMSQEERQNPPNPDPGFSLYSGSSSDPLAAMGSEQSPPQPQ